MRLIPLALLVGTIVSGIVLGAHAAPNAVLELRDVGDGGRILRTVRLNEPASFSLTFTHSMYGGQVTETYDVLEGSNPRLQRSTVQTENGAAAEYYARYGNFRQQADDWVVEVPPMVLDDLAVRVDRTGNPRLAFGNTVLTLLDVVPDGYLVEVRPVMQPASALGSIVR